MNSLGIVILTYPGDFHLSKVLIKSLEYFNPEIKIKIIPGTGFNLNDHPFEGYEIVSPPEGVKKHFSDYYDRKFWAFFSGFENFLYCDADIICLSPFLDSLRKVIPQQERFILANLPNEVYGLLKDGTDDRKRKIETGGQLGQLDAIKDFDPQYDYYKNYLINSGLFLSSSVTFNESELIDFRMREIDFYQNKLSKKFDSASLYDLFYGDQGRINYLIHKEGILLDSLFPTAHYQWGGKPFNLDRDKILKGKSSVPFIHWAGCPKPSYSIFNDGALFNMLIEAYGNLGYTRKDQKNVPCQELWEYFDNDRSLSRILGDSRKEFMKFIYPYLKGRVRRIL